MKLTGILLFILVFACTVQAQVSPATYWISFNYKGNTTYNFQNPQDFLSQRAIERRQRYSIPIDSTDLPVNQAYIDQILNAGNITFLFSSRWMNGVAVFSLDTAAIDSLINFPFVNNVRSAWNKKPAHDVKEETLVKCDFSPYYKGYYGLAFNQINMLSGQQLHKEGYLGKGMVIAVLDAGFSGADDMEVFDHLREENRILGTKDIVGGGNDVYGNSTHGTYVLSTMAAFSPGSYVGTAPQASYLLVRTENTSSEFILEEYNWIAGAEYADSAGADIINTSLGYTTFDDPSQNHTYNDLNGNTTPITIGSDMAAKKGMLLVTSAGNLGNNTWFYISAPADGDSVLTVGAVDENEEIAPFSSHGPTSDGRIKPDVVAQGKNTAIAGLNNTFFQGGGTSFSAPIISGMSACLWQAFPHLSNMEIYQKIVASSSHYLAPNNERGHGIPNFYEAYLELAEVDLTSFDGSKVLNIYPNPFQSHVFVRVYSDKEQEVSAELVNQLGQVVGFSSAEVGEGDYCLMRFDDRFILLASGLYLLKIYTEENTFVYKLVKE